MTQLTQSLAEISRLAEPVVLSAGAIFLRVGAMVAFVPGFGEQSIPLRLRLAIAVAFTAIVTPAVIADVPPDLAIYPAEVIVGLMLGVGFRFILFGLQMAAVIIGQSTSIAQLFGGIAGDAQPAVGNLLTMAGIALAMSAGLHVRAAELLILSYQMMPAGRILPAPDLAQWGIGQALRATSLAFSLAAPFVGGALLYNVALGVINRAMPQLAVSFIGAPALTLAGILFMMLAAPLVLQIWLGVLNGWMAEPLGLP